MARELVGSSAYGGVLEAMWGKKLARMDAELRLLARLAKEDGIHPDSVTVEDGERSGDYVKLLAYREVA